MINILCRSFSRKFHTSPTIRGWGQSMGNGIGIPIAKKYKPYNEKITNVKYLNNKKIYGTENNTVITNPKGLILWDPGDRYNPCDGFVLFVNSLTINYTGMLLNNGIIDYEDIAPQHYHDPPEPSDEEKEVILNVFKQ